jgi:predicted secreted protein
MLRQVTTIIAHAGTGATLCAWLLLGAAPAADAAALLRLQTSASDAVAPDVAVATLAAVRQGPDVGALNDAVGALLDAALRRARATPGISASTGGYSTEPRMGGTEGHETVDGWTVRATLVLRSADFAALGRLSAELGRGLQIESIGSDYSPALRQRERDALQRRAIAEFRARAQSAAQDFGYRGWALHEVDVGELQGADGPPLRMQLMAAVAAPLPVAPSARRLSLTVSGSVELQR